MTRLAKALLTIILVIAGVSCYDHIKIGDLTPDVAQQLKGFLQNPIGYSMKADCKSRLRSNTEFLLYTRNNQDNATILNISNPGQMDTTKKVVILFHGWLSGPGTAGIVKLKDAYLKRYDCNVIVVNWSKAAFLPYAASYCHVPAVAQYVAKALCYLGKQTRMPLDKIHIVGHSMGAHMAGWVSKFITSKCKATLGRITALDPAGPIFDGLPDSKRLEKADAAFVDVIHTDSERFGSRGKIGHSEFYVNCGLNQPGCTAIKEISNDTLLSDVLCSHHRSMEYMAESVNSNNYIAVSCGLCPRYCRADIISEIYRVMGENCKHESRPTRNFNIPTKSSPPFSEGWDAYPSISTRFV